MGLTRRSLLTTTGAVAGLTALGVNSQPSNSAENENVDVAVIGAGLSGLIATRELKKQGRRVRLLEAKNQIGGRMVNQRVAGNGVVDLGGQWGGYTHKRLADLADELGLKRYPAYYKGKSIFNWNGKSISTELYSDIKNSIGASNPKDIDMPESVKAEALAIWSELFTLASTISPEQPWNSPNAKQLDAIPVSQWLAERNASPLAQWQVGRFCRVNGAQVFEPYEASMLHLAWTMAVSPPQEFPEAWLLYDGAGEVAKRLAAELGSDVLLNSPVSKLKQTDAGVTVVYGDNQSLTCQAAVVAIPPILRLNIQFDPPLPPRFLQLMQRTPMPSKWKVIAVYPTAFWRQQGYCGASNGNLPVLEVTADACPPSGTPGIITSFVSAQRVSEINQLSEQSQRKLILKDLVSLLGDEAGAPVELIIKRWTEDPWQTGGYGLTRAPGAWTAYGSTWQDAHGKVFWAGTEQSTRWAGYFEGAIEAGLTAAKKAAEVII